MVVGQSHRQRGQVAQPSHHDRSPSLWLCRRLAFGSLWWLMAAKPSASDKMGLMSFSCCSIAVMTFLVSRGTKYMPICHLAIYDWPTLDQAPARQPSSQLVQGMG